MTYIEELNIYLNAFSKLQEYIKNSNEKAKTSEINEEGYLVNHQNYNNLLQLVLKKNDEAKMIRPNLRDDQNEYLYKLPTESKDNLKKDINNGYSFLIINKDFFNEICDKKDSHKINYKISKEYITIQDGANPMIFKNGFNNIINKSTYLENIENNNNNSQNNGTNTPNQYLNDIYNDIINYYNSENDIIQKTKSARQEEFQGYLIDNTWVEEWKKFSDYNNIKRLFSLSGSTNESKIKEHIQKHIGNDKNDNISKYNEIKNIEKYILKNGSDINLPKNANKKFNILEPNFLNSFNFTTKNDRINFIILNKTIYIKILQRTIGPFNIDENIIISPENMAPQTQMNTSNNNSVANEKDFECIKHLIKILYFKRDLQTESITFKNIPRDGYILNREIIEKLQKKYDKDNKFNAINQDPRLKGIFFENYDANHPVLSNFLKQNFSNKLYEQEQINFESQFHFKNLKGNPNLIYIDEFEIIDKEFVSLLVNLYNARYIFPIKYAIIDKKIFIIIFLENTCLYEIVNLVNGNYNVEYLIEITQNKNSNKDYILEIFCKNGIQKFINMPNPITNDIISFNLHPIQTNLHKNPSINIKSNTSTKDEISGPSYNRSTYEIAGNKNVMTTSNDINSKKHGNTSFCFCDSTNSEKRQKRINNQMENNGQQKTHINNITLKKKNGDQKQVSQTQIIQNPDKGKIINKNNENENEEKNNIKKGETEIPKDTSSIKKKTNPVPAEEKNPEQNLTSNIAFILGVIREREKLLMNITQPNGNRYESTKQYYLISKNYMSEINSTFHINDIYEIIQKNQRLNESEIINFIKENLAENKKMELDCLSKENIQKSLDRKEIYSFNHYYVNNDKSTNLLYYKNCDIISGNILNSFRTIDKNINNKVQIVECIFDKSTIVLFIQRQIIYVVNYNKEITETKYIIVSSGQNNNYNLQQIFQVFGNEGIDNFMKKYVKSNLIQFNINLVNQQYLVQANIYKINSNGEIEYEYKPSSKLKTLLLLSISQQYNIQQSKDEKVYLINPEWLKELQYEKIKSFVYQKTYGRTGIWNYTYNIDSILNIFQNADNNILKAYDSQLNIQPKNNWQIPVKTITLLDNKYIDLYKQFVLVNGPMFEQIKNNFGITPTKENISHVYSNTDGDFIIFKNYQSRISQNSNNMLNYILVGNINKEKYEFDIKHIFDYNDKNILESELQTILSIKIHNYISQRTFLSSYNNNGNFSPIIYNNKLIGNYYKYGKDFNIGNCINYSKYIKNKKLLTSIYLYKNLFHIYNNYQLI